MNLVLIGPQASGKGTQAKRVSEKLGVLHISTGDLLRNSEGELKEKVDSYMNSGELVPDELMLDIIEKRLSQEDAQNGFVLDGFPRNLKQAKELMSRIKIDKIIGIKLSDETAVERISNRTSCSNCGAVFNTKTNPSKKQGICDFCDSELIKRDDDKEEAVRKRLEIYHNETEPILKKYNAEVVDGKQDIDKVSEDIFNILEK